MKLFRLALAKFGKPIDDRYKSLKAKIHAVEIQTNPVNFEGIENKDFYTVLFIAKVGFEGLPNDSDGFIEIPEYPRKVTEEAIENLANFISIASRSEKSICSIYPYIGLSTETTEEKNFVKEKKGISVMTDGRLFPKLSLPFAPELLNYLFDRFDGVTLLAEAINQKTSLGKFRQLTQFFERAFARSSTQYPNRLNQFLSQSPYGYTRTEVEYWSSLRHPAMHGDGKKTSDFVLERDVNPIIRRMEQAAYEVLFNKLNWNSNSEERRQIYQPLGATADKEESKGVVVSGATVQMEHYFLDTFGSYEIYNEINLSRENLEEYFSEIWFPPNLIQKQVEK